MAIRMYLLGVQSIFVRNNKWIALCTPTSAQNLNCVARQQKVYLSSHAEQILSVGCNGSVHNLFRVRALQICNNLGQHTVTGLCKYIAIVTDVLFTGMVMLCLIQLCTQQFCSITYWSRFIYSYYGVVSGCTCSTYLMSESSILASIQMYTWSIKVV